jgi:VWFA-related protein
MNWFLRILVFVVLATTCIADSIVYMRVHRPLIEEQLKLAPATEPDRIKTLRSLFQKGGCPQVIEQQVPNQDFPNLICILHGDEEGTIVVGASSDYASQDAAAPGGWSSLAMLPLLTESLSLVPHRFTFMFIAFTGHEHGMSGASWYVKQLTDNQRKTIRAMVDLDNLGMTPPVFVQAQPDKTLATWLQVASQSLRIAAPLQVDASAANLSDQPFQQEHIPAIAIQSAAPAMLPALQRTGAIPQGVTGTEFNVDTYDDTYRLMCVYVLYLDRNLGRPLIEPGIYSGRIIDTAGVFTTSPVDVSVRIDRFNTTGELNRYESILAKGGQEALADALDNADEKGIFRFGLSVAYGVKIIALQNSGKTPYILLVSPRANARQSMSGNSRSRSSAVGAATTSNNYRFTVIKLTLDGKGNGDGLYYNTAKLRFNKQHELEIEDFGSKPDNVQHVQLEQPTLPRTAPLTATAAAGKAQIPSQSATASVQQPTQPDLTSANVVQSAGTGTPPATTIPVTPAPTFHAKAQLVQVDIAVTDAHGQPIRGLQQSDFTVLEDGKPQEIRAFDAHVPGTNEVASATPASVSPTPLPPHVFTNRVVAHAEDNLSILMLDLLNTPVPDQAYARKQTIEFLKTLPRGKRIAMFVLSKKLVMVQGFTDDSATLVAAAEKVLNDRSFLLTTEADRQQFQGFTDEIARNASTPAVAAGAPAGAISSGNVADSPFGFAQQRQQSNAITEADRTSVRVNFTLDALTAVARSVSAYPGRKNLIWLSGTFPVRLKPTGIDFYRLNRAQSDETSTGVADTPDFKAAIRVMTTALATARIAVFPMDVRGLQAGGVDLTVGAAESASFSSTENPEAYKDNLNTQSETRFQERSSIKEVAEQTGGEVLEGNDVRRAIGKALDDSSTYYTLAYTPAGDESNTQFRKIEVKLNRGGVKLAYRPGYYATATPDTPAQRAHPLIVAMQPGMPASTVIPLTVEVLPPDGSSKKTRINYTIDIRGIDFTDTPEHRKRAVIDFIAVAFTQAGMPAGQISNAMDATLGPADYESAQRTGLVVKQELELPPGKYNLRMGVMDRGSQKIGTLDVPLTVTATSAAK